MNKVTSFEIYNPDTVRVKYKYKNEDFETRTEDLLSTFRRLQLTKLQLQAPTLQHLTMLLSNVMQIVTLVGFQKLHLMLKTAFTI